MPDIQTYIERASDGKDLTQEQAREASHLFFEEATDAQIGGLLTAIRTKGRSDQEVAGFAEGMREAARTIDPEPGDGPMVDTGGTGGDDYNTINISTAGAIVAAGAGVPVAKHGNYSISSASGSADVLQSLDVDIEADPSAVETAIEENGVGFMLATVFHPAMKAVTAPRQELGVRNIFNVVVPLTNPAGVDAQVIGVYDSDLVDTMANALARLPVEHGLVVHGSGLDEVAIHDETIVAEVQGDDVERYTVGPADFGLDRAPVDAIAGGQPEENAADLRAIVEGEETGPKRDVVLANAGAAIYVAGEAENFEDGTEQARKAIEEGGAVEKLQLMQQSLVEPS